MAFILHPDWSSAGTYTEGQRVNFVGVTYENITGNFLSSTDPSQDGLNWEAVAVTQICDYNSLYEAVRLELNTEVPKIEDSIPMFIQLAEESFKTRIRAPQMRRTVNLQMDAQGRIMAPEDLIEVINIRFTTQSSTALGVFSRGTVEILNANYEEFREVREYFDGQTSNFIGSLTRFEAPLYWFDDRYFNIAPTMDEGTEVELVYYGVIPKLGQTVGLINDAGLPVNSAGQTQAQWVAAGNTADTFVQATERVMRNWYTQAAPQMLLYGSLIYAESYLRDGDNRIALWREQFEKAELETEHMIQHFRESQPHTVQISNGYLS